MRVRKEELNSSITDKVVRVHFLTAIADFYSGVSRHLPTLTPCTLSQKNTYHPLDLSQFLTSFQPPDILHFLEGGQSLCSCGIVSELFFAVDMTKQHLFQLHCYGIYCTACSCISIFPFWIFHQIDLVFLEKDI